MLRALSIRQPWAWAIAAGHKRVENRSWSTSYRGKLAIHASRVVETEAFRHIEQLAGAAVPFRLATGAIVAVAHLVEVVTTSSDPWFHGPYGFLLTDVVAIPPVPCVGRQQLFKLPDEVEQAVQNAIGRLPPA